MEDNVNNVLKNKNFNLLFIGTLVSNVGATFYSFSISLYILSITNNNATLQGLYLGLCGVIFLLFTPIGGVLADRMNKTKIVYGTDYIRGIIIVVSSILIYFFGNKINLIIILIFVVGALLNSLSAIFNPASTSLIRFLVDENQILQATAYFNSLHSLESILGIILAGILYTIFKNNIYYLFFIVGICYILSGLSEMFIKYKFEKNDDALTIKKFSSDFVGGFEYLLTKKAILTLVFATLFLNFFLSPYFESSSYLAKVYLVSKEYLFSNVISPEMLVSFFGATLSVGSLVTGIIIGNKKAKDHYSKTIKTSLILFSLCFTILVLGFYFFILKGKYNEYLIISLFIYLFLGILLVYINVPISTIIYRDIEKNQLAKVNSLITLGSLGLTPISASIGGIVIDNLGLGILYVICAVGFLITTILVGLNKKVAEL